MVFLPAQSSSPSAEQISDIPVPERGVSGSGGLQGCHPRQGSLHGTVEQIVDIPVPGGGPQDFLPDPGTAALSAVSREELSQGIFRTFPCSKKVRRSPGVRARGCTHTRAHPRRRHMSPWIQSSGCSSVTSPRADLPTEVYGRCDPASVRNRDRRTEARTGPGPLCPRNGRPHPGFPGVT